MTRSRLWGKVRPRPGGRPVESQGEEIEEDQMSKERLEYSEMKRGSDGTIYNRSQ